MSRACERCSAVVHRPCQSSDEWTECKRITLGNPSNQLPRSIAPVPTGKTRTQLEAMSVKELRRYAIDEGYGITYLGERRKADIVKILLECEATRASRA